MAQFRAPKFYTSLFTTSSTPRLGCYVLDCATILTVYTSCLGMTSWAVVHALENVEGNSRVWIERGISVGTSSFASHYVKISWLKQNFLLFHTSALCAYGELPVISSPFSWKRWQLGRSFVLFPTWKFSQKWHTVCAQDSFGHFHKVTATSMPPISNIT